MMHAILIVLITLWAPGLLAKDALPHSVYETLRRSDDDPRALSRAAREQSKVPVQAREAWGWVVFSQYQNIEKDEDPKLMSSDLEAALAWAKERKLRGLTALLMSLKGRQSADKTIPAPEMIAWHEDLVAISAADAEPWAYLKLVLDYSSFLLTQNQSGNALAQIEKARALIAKLNGEAHDYASALISNELAVQLEARNRFDEALDLHKRVREFCKQHQARSFCAKNAFNIGALYSNRQDIVQVDQATPFFELAVALGKEISDDHRVGVSTLGLANVAMKKNQYKLAEHQIRLALPVFERNQNKVWLGDSWMKLAVCLMRMDRYDEAETALKNARSSFPKHFFADFVALDEMQSELYQKMGRYKEAYGFLAAYVAGYKKITDDQREMNFQEKALAVGLQLEEEKSRKLQADLEQLRMMGSESAALKSWLKITASLAVILIVLSTLLAIRLRAIRSSQSKGLPQDEFEAPHDM